MKLEDRSWWPELVTLKDVLSLRELSARYGAAPAAIANALRRNGMDRQPAPSGPRANRDQRWQRAAQVAVERSVPAKVEPTRSTAVRASSSTRPEAPRGYRATIGSDAYVIIASDIADATQLAVRASRGPVVSVVLLGAALSADAM